MYPFYFLFLLLTLSTLTSPQSWEYLPTHGSLACESFGRTSGTCPKVHEPVCADTPQLCYMPPCPQFADFPSICEACKDSAIQTFTPGLCVYTCGLEYIDESSRVPVCASGKGCEEAWCQRTYKNSYAACEDPLVVWYTVGACEGNNGEREEFCEEFLNEENGEYLNFEQELDASEEDASILLVSP